MNIYKVSQQLGDEDYRKYDSVIVVAESEEIARLIHPEFVWADLDEDPNLTLSKKLFKAWSINIVQLESWWIKLEDINSLAVEYLGKADESLSQRLVLLGSFNQD